MFGGGSIKAVILCGGNGQRIGSQELNLPKALVPVMNKPLITYVMRLYQEHGVDEFILCGGFLIEKLYDYFESVGCRTDSAQNQKTYTSVRCNGSLCRVDILDTGLNTKKIDRLKMALPLIGKNDFFVSYCDCISDLDLDAFLEKHRSLGKQLTVAVTNPQSRYGHITCEGDLAVDMQEKPILRDIWINCGYMLFSPDGAERLLNESTGGELESEYMPELAGKGELAVYRHRGNWANIETAKDVTGFERNNGRLV